MAGKPSTVIEFGKILNSNSSGPFQIIGDMGRDDHSRLYIKIKFLNTGNTKVVRYDIAMAGKILDELNDINFDKIYDSVYYGKFKIIRFIGRKSDSSKIVRIKFLNTGYEYDVLLDQVITGQVRDYSIDFHNRNFDPVEENRDRFIKNILYGRWKSMISRCYDKNNKKYPEYGGVGITVCDKWKTLNGYLSTISTVKNYDKFYNNPNNYQLDKDFLQQNIPTNHKVYSPSTCIFLSSVDNANLSMMENNKHGDFYGVRETYSGNYQVIFCVKGKRKVYGIYDDIMVAASEYNYYYLQFADYDNIPLLNEGIPNIPHEEALKHLVNKNANTE